MINEEYINNIQKLYKEHKILLEDLSMEELCALTKLYERQNKKLENHSEN